MKEFIEAFQERISKDGVELAIEKIEQLAIHYQLMLKWNKTHNLTRITSVKDAIEKHYMDCIYGLSFVSTDVHIHDLGSGAGFPGLVGAILRPNQSFTLVEPARKRTSFLSQVKSSLNLSNVTVLQGRAESIEGVACTVSRGTFPWPNHKPLIRPLCDGGTSYLWIGQTPSKEEYCQALQNEGLEVSWKSYELGESGKRHMGIAVKPEA